MRRLISLISASVALIALGLVLYNATVVDRRGPEVTRVSLSAPAGDERVAQTLTAIDLEFSEQVRASTVESRFRIEPYVAGAFTWDGSRAIFTPSAKLPPDTEFTITLAPGFEDLVGNVATDGVEPWVFRTVGPPVVLGSTPGDGATGVAIEGASISVVFDRLMDTVSVEEAVRLDPGADFRAAWSGETLTLLLEEELRFGTTYTLSIGTGAADTGGNRLVQSFSTSFSTVAAGLSIVDTIPASGASGIGVRTPIAITFDAPIDEASARAAFRITPSVGGDIQVRRLADDLAPAGAEPDTANPDAIVFVPDAPLAPHTTYTVTLDGSVARLDDPGSVAGGRGWSFTTGSPAVTGQNQVAFLSSRSGVRNIWLMNPDGTNPRQVTTELVPVSGFDATGDGSGIAYSAGGVVRLIRIDGELLETITDAGTYEYAPAFTPDDRALIVGRRGGNGEDLGYWIVPLPGSDTDERQLLDAGAPPIGSAALGGEGIEDGEGMPIWMPRLAFDPTGEAALLVTAANETIAFDLAARAGDVPPSPVNLEATSAPAWSSRHGAFLLTAVASGGNGTVSGDAMLWSIATSGAIAPLDGSVGATGPVAVAVDGSIAVGLRADADAAIELAVLERSASSFEGLSSAEARAWRWPSFAPDGRSIVVGQTLDARPTESAGIWSIDVATGMATQLTTDGAYARWLP